jgi:hypothetical protein
MASFLLFITLLLLVSTIFWFIVGGSKLLDPFATKNELRVAFIMVFALGPAFGAATIQVGTEYNNYCPPVGPVPTLAEATSEHSVVPTFQDKLKPLIEDNQELGSLLADAQAENARLANELSLRTTALATAQQTIVELQKRIATLEATRIKSPVPTPVPVAAPNRGRRCTAHGCN